MYCMTLSAVKYFTDSPLPMCRLQNDMELAKYNLIRELRSQKIHSLTHMEDTKAGEREGGYLMMVELISFVTW
jgi:hypothetical protein